MDWDLHISGKLWTCQSFNDFDKEEEKRILYTVLKAFDWLFSV